MMTAANAYEFDVLLVMELSRLSRSQSDLPKAIDRLTHRGVRVVGIQDGYDSSRKGHKLQAGLSGIVGEAFREMVAERTYTALQSRALRGDKTGGRAYGYREGEAETVRKIFDWYANGRSARWIARTLNEQDIPSPGASWKRTQRRRGGWHPSAISGDPKRGIGILNNETYIGSVIWNRSRWIKDPDTGRRRAKLRPESERITHQVPELRLIDKDIWRRVKARQARRVSEVGNRIRLGKRSPGRAARYLFSTLIKCGVCGSNCVMSDGTKYACSGFVNGHVCTNGIRVRRDVLEERLLKAIKDELLTDAAINEFRRRVTKALRRPDPLLARRRKLNVEIGKLTDAIAQGLISPAVVQRLKVAETELAGIPPPAVVDLDAALAGLPRAVERYRDMVTDLGNAVLNDVERAREAIREMVGEIRVTPKNGHLVYEMGLNETPLTALAGGAPQIDVVAGACFDRTLAPVRLVRKQPKTGRRSL